MQTMPNATEPMDLPPPRGGGTPPDRGLAQLVVTSLLVVLAFSAGWFGNGYVNRNNTIPNDAQHKYQYVMNETWNDINANFAVPISTDLQQKMAYDAIDAMIKDLNDPGHTRFETPEQYNNETNSLNAAGIVGIGAVLSGGGKDPITIVAVYPDTPAAQAGLQAGDQIVAVNGTDVRGMTLAGVSALIRGNEGTSVTLSIVRPSVGAASNSTPTATPTPKTTPAPTIQVTLVRKKYTPQIAVSFVIPQLNIADIQIIDFAASPNDDTQTTHYQLKAAIQQAQQLGVKGIILDLRGNGGGYLGETFPVASQFIPAGQGKNVVIIRSRTGQDTSTPVQPGGLATTTPLAVLVDNNTASAAEIVAGAIAVDRPDAHIVGQTTYGTGTVLEPYTLADGSQLVLGTHLWLLPNGTSIWRKGLAPDQPVALPAGLTPLTVLAAPGNKATYEYIQRYNDTQLLQAIKDLQG